MAHGGCFGIGFLLIFCLQGEICKQNQSRVYNVQVSQSYIVAALWATERQVCYILSTPLSHAFGCGFFICDRSKREALTA